MAHNGTFFRALSFCLSAFALAACFGTHERQSPIGSAAPNNSDAQVDAGPNGCTSNRDCSQGKYCSFPRGTCGGSGVCQTRADDCPENYDPVCGCDGNDYGNACEAEIAGISIQRSGTCPHVGPPIANPLCEVPRRSFVSCSGITCDGLPQWTWDGFTCISVECGSSCFGVDCGRESYRLYNEQSECVQAHRACDAALCESTEGRWHPESCGHWNCGEEPACRSVIPGCDCGPNANFVDGQGCVSERSCAIPEPATPEGLCNTTGGRSLRGCCPLFECGVLAHPDVCDCGELNFFCDCPDGETFDAVRGCISDPSCLRRQQGQRCRSHQAMSVGYCAEGLFCEGSSQATCQPRCDR